MRFYELRSFQNVECRTRGYFESLKNMTTGENYIRYRQGSALVSSCGTNLLPLSTDPAKAVFGNQPAIEEPKCYLDAWTNKTYGIQTLYDNVTDVFWC